jgi:aminoglycoside phosphotransferase (APT) family kinase protein
VPWLCGASALHAGFDRGADGRALGDFLHRLHAPAPPDAPRNPWRGVPLAERTGWLCEHARAADDHGVDPGDAMRVWNDALSAKPWSGPPLWIHGDLHPGNLLVREGAISAVIDFGDLTSGDPATDFACVWMLGAPFVVSGLVETARNEWTAADDDLMRRARGWALAIGLAILASPHADAPMQRMAAATVMAALQHEVAG